MGHTFQASCRFWHIIQEVLVVSSSSSNEILQNRVTLAFVESRYQKLLDLADRLEPDLARGENTMAHALVFQ